MKVIKSIIVYSCAIISLSSCSSQKVHMKQSGSYQDQQAVGTSKSDPLYPEKVGELGPIPSADQQTLLNEMDAFIDRFKNLSKGRTDAFSKEMKKKLGEVVKEAFKWSLKSLEAIESITHPSLLFKFNALQKLCDLACNQVNMQDQLEEGKLALNGVNFLQTLKEYTQEMEQIERLLNFNRSNSKRELNDTLKNNVRKRLKEVGKFINAYPKEGFSQNTALFCKYWNLKQRYHNVNEQFTLLEKRASCFIRCINRSY